MFYRVFVKKVAKKTRIFFFVYMNVFAYFDVAKDLIRKKIAFIWLLKE